MKRDNLYSGLVMPSSPIASICVTSTKEAKESTVTVATVRASRNVNEPKV